VWTDGGDGPAVSIVALKWFIRSDTVVNLARTALQFRYLFLPENELVTLRTFWSGLKA